MKVEFDGTCIVADAKLSDGFHSKLCDDLNRQGWSEHSLFLSNDLTRILATECRQLHLSDKLRSANVGRGSGKGIHANIRSDQIAWLQTGQSDACDAYLQIMEQLRLSLNRTLYLGLEDFESHFSFFQIGAFYSKHLDRFQSNDARTVSIVIYLNDHWLDEDGGELRLHPQYLNSHDIAPTACRLVVFLSAEILHEVLPTKRDRMSLAGWFRRRAGSA